MAINTSEILDILSTHNVVPEEHAQGLDVPVMDGQEFPEISEIEEGETVYTTSIAEVFREDDEGGNGILGIDC